MSRQYPPLLSCMALLIAGVLLLAGPAMAKNYSFEASDKQLSDENRWVHAYWDAQLKLFTLIGDPVVSVRIRYQFNPNMTRVSLPTLDGSNRDFQLNLGQLPGEAYTLLNLYDVKVRFEFRTNVNFPEVVYLTEDVGDPGPSDGKTWSFNVPGSPNWDKFLTRASSGGYGRPEDANIFLSEDEAKKVYAAGLQLSDATIVSYKVTAFDLQNWYAAHTKWPEVRATIEAYNYLTDAVRRSTGLRSNPIKQMTYDALTDGTLMGTFLANQDDTLYSVRKKLDKLMNLPDSFIPEDNPGPYETAIKEAPKIISKTRDYAKEWRSSELASSTLKKGYPPKGIEPDIRIEASARDAVNRREYTVLAEGKPVKRGRLDYLSGIEEPQIFSHYVLQPVTELGCPWDIAQRWRDQMCQFIIIDINTGKYAGDNLFSGNKSYLYGSVLSDFLRYPYKKLPREDTFTFYEVLSTDFSTFKYQGCEYNKEDYTGNLVEVDSELRVLSKERVSMEHKYESSVLDYDHCTPPPNLGELVRTSG